MREVNNNTANPGNVNFQGVQPRNLKETNIPLDMPPVETSEVTDLGKMPAEVIGRSQVSKSALEKDLAPFFANPELVEKSLRFYEMCEHQGISPVDAAALMGGFADEFLL